MEARTSQPISKGDVEMLKRQNLVLSRICLILFSLCFIALALLTWQVRRVARDLTQDGKMLSTQQLNLLDENGKISGMFTGGSDGALVFLNGPKGKVGLTFGPGPEGSGLTLSGPSGDDEISLVVGDPYAWISVGSKEKGGEKVELSAGGGIHRVAVADDGGTSAVLGGASLKRLSSGDSVNTSAATLTLFRNDGRVLWMTPRE